MCLIWDHGGGSVSGVAFDELYQGDSLNIDELSKGLSMAGVQFIHCSHTFERRANQSAHDLQLEITDLFGKTYQSDFIAISVKDGKLAIINQ